MPAANVVVLADLRTVGQARKLLALASRYVANGQDTIDGVYRKDRSQGTFVDAGKSALNSAARWVRDAQGLLPAGDENAALTKHQQEKAFYSYKQALETMKLVEKLANDGQNWVDDLQTAAKQTLGAVAQAAGGAVGFAADLAGTAAGGIAGGFFKNLGFGAIGLAVVIGGALYIKSKASL